ncbi:MAG: methionyl-tRNA formyltransferase [Caldisericia bacterium]|nr:methionyl-tRNA formyltransferase [Caldisericia bacterium]
MKITFFGSDFFSLPFLEELYNKGYEINLIITTPDKPKGRGLKIEETPTKTFAKENKLNFIEVDKFKNYLDIIEKNKGDIGVVVSFGKIIPQSLLNIFPKGIINVHPSLLPKYRGPNPIRWQILNGEKKSGITIIKLTSEVDAGPILIQKEIFVDENDNYSNLSKKLIESGKEILIEAIKIIENGKDVWIEQKGEATFAPKFESDFEKLDFRMEGDYLRRKILALSFEPGAYSFFREKRVKILDALIIDDFFEGEPGEIVFVDKNSFGIKTKDKVLIPKIIKIEGKKEMGAKEFINGYKPKLKEKFI